MKVVVNQVNAFVAGLGSGNPAGVVADADHLNEGQMLKIASSVGFSETAFISKSKFATKKLRFFTPTEEVDLCGHATIASWAFMQKSTGLKAGEYAQETKAGLLKVDVDQEGLVYMEQATPRFYQNINSDQIADCFGINEQDLRLRHLRRKSCRLD
jgi:PhzF family phenazine biosynthesis protein